MIVDLQLSPATTPWPVYRDCVRAAEEAGFGALWVFDHLSGRMLDGDSMLECFTLLGALTAMTERMQLGTLVVNAGTRHAGLLASAAASAQIMSGGRLLLGLGAGAAPGTPWSREFDMLGIELPEKMVDRHSRLVDVLDTVDTIWSDPATFPGFPRPVRRPPVILGVNSDRLARIAAERADGVNVLLGKSSSLDLLELAQEVRRDAPPSDGPWIVTACTMYDEGLFDPDHAVRRRLESIGVERLILVILPTADVRTIERASRYLRG